MLGTGATVTLAAPVGLRLASKARRRDAGCHRPPHPTAVLLASSYPASTDDRSVAKVPLHRLKVVLVPTHRVLRAVTRHESGVLEQDLGLAFVGAKDDVDA